MVEAFKYLNYCQLAEHSLVSKRFRNLIQTHRRKLALLYVHDISMSSFEIVAVTIDVFEKKISRKTYDDWVIRNSYSKQIPIESQFASEESTQNIRNGYWLATYAYYKDQRKRNDRTTVFSADVELNNENWPLFQHFARLVTDPFIYIFYVRLPYQNDVLNLLARAINSDYCRLQCERLIFNLNGNSQASITWIKNHVRCNKLHIFDAEDLNYDEAFLDFFVTGAHCIQLIEICYYDLSKVVTDFVQKFIDLKNSNESQFVEAFEGKISVPAVELFERDYAKFIVKEERRRNNTDHIFAFVNNDIRKKLQLTAKNYESNISFSSALIVSAFRLIIKFDEVEEEEESGPNKEFRIENRITNEVLKLKIITEKDAFNYSNGCIIETDANYMQKHILVERSQL